VKIARLRRFVLLVAVPLAVLATIGVHFAVAQTVAEVEPAATQKVIVVATTLPSDATSQPVINLQDLVTGKAQLSAEQAVSFSFWQSTIDQLVRMGLAFVPRLLVALVLFSVFYVIFRITRKVAMTSAKAAGLDESIRDMLARIIKVIILGFGLVIACNQVGIEIAALLTGVSIIGLAVGFAAQESISNFIAGVMIFLDKPFKVGDWIEVDGHTGQVKRVTFRSTRMSDLTGNVVVFPNTAMLNRKLVNKSSSPKTRVAVTIPIPADKDIAEARRVLLAEIANDPRVERHPEPEVSIKGVSLAEQFVLLHFWITEERYEDAMTYEYLERAKRTLDAAGLTKKAA
jgi:small conductance mechanosensitive channel